MFTFQVEDEAGTLGVDEKSIVARFNNQILGKCDINQGSLWHAWYHPTRDLSAVEQRELSDAYEFCSKVVYRNNCFWFPL